MEQVVNRLLWRVQTSLPVKLAELRTRYGVVDNSLPDIAHWLTYEPDDIAVDRPPMIVIVEQESDTLNGPVRMSSDFVAGSTFEWRYHLVVFAWAVGDTFEATATARRRYGLAVRECLLQMPGLGDPDPGSMTIDPLQMTETYSAVARDGQSREIIAATGISVQYRTQEYLGPRLAPLGDVGSVVPTVGLGAP